MKAFAVLIFAFALSACATSRREVRRVAVQDLQCKNIDVKLVDEKSALWKASGCDKSATYYCMGCGFGKVSCEKQE